MVLELALNQPVAAALVPPSLPKGTPVPVRKDLRCGHVNSDRDHQRTGPTAARAIASASVGHEE